MALRSTAAVVLALSAALACASATSAAPQVVTQFVPSVAEGSLSDTNRSFSAPGLYGDAVAWTRAMPTGEWTVQSAVPGSPARAHWISRLPDADTHIVGLVGASPTRIAWFDLAWNVLSAHDMRSQVLRDEFRTTGSNVPVDRCGEGGPPCCTDYCPLFRSSDLDGDVLAYVDGTSSRGDVVVDDLSSDAPPVRLDVQGSVNLTARVAGRYVAYMRLRADDYIDVIVVDWRSGGEVHRVEAQYLYDLQSDGKVLTTGPGRTLSWSSPSEPAHHPIFEVPQDRSHVGLRIAEDRIAMVEYDTAGHQRVVTSDLSGNRHVVAQAHHDPSQRVLVNLAFDGHRVAWTALQCGLVSVLLEPRAMEGVAPAPPACTPPKLRKISRTAGGDIVAHVVCAEGCRGRLRGYFASGFQRRFARRSVELAPSTEPRRVVLRVATQHRKRFRARKVPVQVIFTGEDGGGNTVGTSGVGTLRRP
jgi:translation initiation factor IF-1